MKRHLANILTASRILCAVCMVFLPVFSIPFWIAYCFGGFSDMIDGVIARKFHSSSEFGAKLDTAADFLFVIVFWPKFLPFLHAPNWLWIWIGGIVLIKISNIILEWLYAKRLLSRHTILNKITGLLLFLLPATLPFVEFQISAPVVCAAATLAALHENHLICSVR